MNHYMLRLGRLAGLSAVVAAVLATISLVDAPAATVKPDSCPTNKPMVVNSYATFENAADYGADGHVWALDAATASIQIWHLGGDAYCAKVHVVGTSTTLAGLSPEAIRSHAYRAGLPVDEIVAVADTLVVRPDPQPIAI